MSDRGGLVCAYALDGSGGAKPLDWEQVRQWSPKAGVLWVHLDYSDEAARKWLWEESGLDELVVEALLAEETRPRSAVIQDKLLVTLRGVNLNPGADPEDMVAIRLWVEGNRIISTRHRRLLAVEDLRKELAAGSGPKTPGEFLVDLIGRMVARMSNVIDTIDDSADALEEEVLTAESYELRAKISHLRRQVVSIRRYLAPQREAMARLYTDQVSWIDEKARMRLRELADRTTRYVEDLDSARDRAGVTHEELLSRLSEQLDKRMYLLSMVAVIFLPLGFLTGLLGINVAGIPGAEYPQAFAIVCLIVGVVVVAMLSYFKHKKWF